MTNEELLFEFARELRNGGQHEVASNRAVELRAELLRRLGAAVSASPTLPDKCDCGHKWHGDNPCQWKGREEDMELHCTCPESHRTLTSKDFQGVSASPQPRCPECRSDKLVCEGIYAAPQTSAEPCPICGKSDAHTHQAEVVTRWFKSRAPQPVSGLELCPTCGKPPFCGCPTEPVSGNVSKVEEIVTKIIQQCGLTEKFRYVLPLPAKDFLTNLLRSYFPPASQTPMKINLSKEWLEKIAIKENGQDVDCGVPVCPNGPESDCVCPAHPLNREGYLLGLEIEKLPPSEQQTKCMVQLSAYRQNIRKLETRATPASTARAINTHELAHEILRHRIIILECENGVKPCGEYNGEPIYNMGEMIGAETIAINQLQDVIDAWLKLQPASTARTDGWVSVEERLPKAGGIYEVIIAHAGKEEYRDGADYDPKCEYEWTFSSDPHHVMMDLQVSRWRKFGPLPAAPGSVPPLCNDPDCDDCLDKREALEHAQKGVPQAEPNTKESYERGLKDALAVVKGGKNIVAISNLLKRPAPPSGAAQPRGR